MRLDSLWVAYWSLQDPLCRSQVMPILGGLVAAGYRMGVMTFEQPPWILSTHAQREAQAQLEAQGITWVPRRYHKRPPTLSTAGDVLLGALRARALGPRMVHGRGTIASAVAYLASRGRRALFLNDADGPLSQEYVDAGIWPAGGVVPRLVARAEAAFFSAADANAVLTEIRAREVRGPTRVLPMVVPCAVDSRHFAPRPDEGRRLREELSLEGTVFVYIGKVGGWYLVEPMLDFVAAYQASCGPVTLLVLSTTDADHFREQARRRGIPCHVRSADRQEMPDYLSAGHVGLSFRSATPSQRAASPVKNGEYLACGLPVVSTSGVGDYTQLIANERVGLVVEAFDGPSLRQGASRLAELLKDPALPERCRKVALEHADLDTVVLPRYRELYARMLGPVRREA